MTEANSLVEADFYFLREYRVGYKVVQPSFCRLFLKQKKLVTLPVAEARSANISISIFSPINK